METYIREMHVKLKTLGGSIGSIIQNPNDAVSIVISALLAFAFSIDINGLANAGTGQDFVSDQVRSWKSVIWFPCCSWRV